MSITNIPLGGVISINGRQFAKINNDNQFVALQAAILPGFADGMDMQDFTAEMVNSVPTPTGTDYFLIGNLTDSRDGKTYEARKFADGKVWMVDNLMYGGTTDACNGKSTFSGDGSATATNIFGTDTYGDCRNNPGDPAYGYLYNWQAAMQNTSAYYNTNYTGPTTNVQGICPAGWHIPSGGSSGEFQALHNAASATYALWGSSDSWKGANAGFCSSSVSLGDLGSTGYYWSSTQIDTSIVYYLSILGNSANPANYYGTKYYGFSVRCIKDAVDASTLVGKTMQTFTTEDCNSLSTPSGTNYVAVGDLVDERDGKSYEVRKFTDGKCWMVDNLAYGGAIDACVDKTTFAGSTNASGRAWGYGDCRNNPGSATYGYLYNWQAAMQHASAYYKTTYTGVTTDVQGICASGWHIPTGNTAGEYEALHIAAGASATGFWQAATGWKGVLSGSCSYTGGLGSQDSYASYWSSTQIDTLSVYRLYLSGSGVDPTISDTKLYGLAVRCIKD